jgi:hypothetical protein
MSTQASSGVHTSPAPDGNGWTNSDGSTFRTQKDAINAGRDLARRLGTEHLIHGRDGRIRERNSYGNDPPQRPG